MKYIHDGARSSVCLFISAGGFLLFISWLFDKKSAAGKRKNRSFSNPNLSANEIHHCLKAENKHKSIAVIIPVYNESSTIEPTLSYLELQSQDTRSLEIIVVDAGSSDCSCQIADKVFQRAEFSSKFLRTSIVNSTQFGRGAALNAGASNATADLLLFLHADTLLPANYDHLLFSALADPKVIMTAFQFGVNRASIKQDLPFGLSLMEYCANLRARWLWLPYGDQALCISRKDFNDIGRFQEFWMMEDYDFVKRVGRIASLTGAVIKILDAPALCSARRWEKNGVLKNTVLNWTFVTLFHLGLSPDRIFRLYYGFSPALC